MEREQLIEGFGKKKIKEVVEREWGDKWRDVYTYIYFEDEEEAIIKGGEHLTVKFTPCEIFSVFDKVLGKIIDPIL